MHIQQSVAPSNFCHDQTQDSSDGQVHHFPSMLNTGASQGCLLSHTHLTALPDIRKNSTVTHVHNTAIIGQGEKINHLAKRCAGRNLRLNISKTMKQIVDFRQKEAKTHTLVYISGAEVEQVNCFRFLGISITEKLSCSSLTAIGSFLKKKKRKRKKNF